MTPQEFKDIHQAVVELTRKYLAERPELNFHALSYLVADQVREEHPALAFADARTLARQELKQRVLIGCCRRHPYQARAFFWPRTQGPLWAQRCPYCDRLLDQTTLQLKAAFHRLPVRDRPHRPGVSP